MRRTMVEPVESNEGLNLPTPNCFGVQGGIKVQSEDGMHFASLVEEAAKTLLPMAAAVCAPEPLWVVAVVEHHDNEVRERGLPKFQRLYGPMREVTDEAVVFMDGAAAPLRDLIGFEV